MCVGACVEDRASHEEEDTSCVCRRACVRVHETYREHILYVHETYREHILYVRVHETSRADSLEEALGLF